MIGWHKDWREIAKAIGVPECPSCDDSWAAHVAGLHEEGDEGLTQAFVSVQALRGHAFPPCDVCGATVDDPEATDGCQPA